MGLKISFNGSNKEMKGPPLKRYLKIFREKEKNFKHLLNIMCLTLKDHIFDIKKRAWSLKLEA